MHLLFNTHTLLPETCQRFPTKAKLIKVFTLLITFLLHSGIMFEHKVFNGAHRRMHAWIWIIGLLSIAIVLQVLGTPISFGKTIGTSDLVEAADLEGFSVSSKGVDLFPILQTLFTLHAQELQYRFSFEYAVFRPPHIFSLGNFASTVSELRD